MTFSAGLYDYLGLNTGTFALPTIEEIDGIGDLDATNKRNGIKFKLRRFDSEVSLPGLFDRSFKFDIASEPDNSVWQAIKDAFESGETIEIFAFYKFIDDGSGEPDTGSKAQRAQVIVTDFSPPQKIEDLDVNSVELMLAANLLTGATAPVSDYTVP